MNHAPRKIAGLMAITIVLLVVTRRAYGYIDPGTGSMILQVIIGSLLGMAAMIGIFWRQVTGFIAGLLGRSKKNDADED